MNRRILVLLFSAICFFSINLTFSQNISGKIISLSDGLPVIGAEVALENTDLIVVTNATGKFLFNEVSAGNYNLIVSHGGSVVYQFPISHSDSDTNLNAIEIKTSVSTIIKNDIVVVNLDDLELEDDAGYSIMLTATQDPFQNAARFNLSNGRFRMRGYDNENTTFSLNGLPFNELDDGRISFNTWGGLNDVFRVTEDQLSLRPNSFSFGGIGGATQVDLTASVQRPQTKAVYTYGNRSYVNRLMLTHSSGMQENGWAYSFSVSRRWGNSGYIKGTHFEGTGYFASIDKKISDNHLLNLVIMGSPQRRGRSSGTTQEMYDIAGDNFYNPNWGFQNGEVRNSREYRINQPVAMLRHDWKLNESSKIQTTIGVQKGTFSTTSLDWLYAADPRADYYKNLPSYYEGEVADDVLAYLQSNEAVRQLQWDKLYEINRNRSINVDGVNQNISAYIIEEQHYDNDRLLFNSLYTHTPNVDFNFSIGVNGALEKVHNYKVIDDLLGGQHYIDIDDFAEQDFPDNPEALQNNLDEPNKLLNVGDRLGYDYDIATNKYELWSQASYNFNRFQLFAAGSLSSTSFYREGFVKNGRFPDDSEGKSETQSFINYGAKTGFEYKLNGRNYLYGYASYRTRAPFSRFAYISARTRDEVINDLTSEKILSGEAGYVFKFGGINGRVSGFYTTFKDQVQTSVYYHDELNTFVNYIMNGIDKKHQGIELGIEGNLIDRFSFAAAGSIGQYIYTSRPKATITQDNSSEVLATDKTVYIKNYYVANGPQNVGSFTLKYNAKNYWFLNMTFNYFDNAYLNINPDRRTTDGVGDIVQDFNPELWNSILNQTKLESNYTIDLFGRKSWKFNKYYVALLVSVNNILDNKEFITGGFEQYRYDYENKDVNRFPPRLFYAFGRNYSFTINVSLN